MMTEKLSFHHRSLLQPRLQKIPTFLSEYSFPNLYLFRNLHEYHVLAHDRDVYLTGRTYDGLRFLMPTEVVKAGSLDRLARVARDYDVLFPVDEEWLGAFTGRPVTVTYEHGDSDYVYSVDKISTYPGPKLHAKKNLRNQFLSLYSSEAKPLTEQRMNDAREVLEAWQEESGQKPEETDYFPCRDAFELYDELVLCGGIYYAEGKPAGFIIGEELNGRMFALHFAKAKKAFKGVYQYMFSHFAGILPRRYEWLNFEQDIGRQALRIAKSSYHPDRILRKYRVQFLD